MPAHCGVSVLAIYVSKSSKYLYVYEASKYIYIYIRTCKYGILEIRGIVGIIGIIDICCCIIRIL